MCSSNVAQKMSQYGEAAWMLRWQDFGSLEAAKQLPGLCCALHTNVTQHSVFQTRFRCIASSSGC
jgi:hypothetical protein